MTQFHVWCSVLGVVTVLRDPLQSRYAFVRQVPARTHTQRPSTLTCESITRLLFVRLVQL